MAGSEFLDALRQIVGVEQVLADPDVRRGYERDWTGRFGAPALAVVRPGDTREVAATVASCAAHRVAVVPQGGNTGLVGGGVPQGGEVLISLARLSDVALVDVAAAQITVGAGATLAAVQSAARAVGFDVGVDLGARDSATIGGMVATNAGGMQVFRYGTMRQHVIGVEVVLADGSVVERLSGVIKDNTGYHLSGLFVGSEGTLGVLTRVRLALVRYLPERAVALVGCRSIADGVVVARALDETLDCLSAMEFTDAVAQAVVEDHLAISPPLGDRQPVLLLVECADRVPVADRLVAALADAVGDRPTAFGADTDARRALWRHREQLTEALNATTVPVKLDVALPLSVLDRFAREVGQVITRVHPGARTALFGHLLDGNVHVNVNDVAARIADPVAASIERAVLELVASFGGSISAEHGIGRAKAPYLTLGRSPLEIATMRAIKDALDPHGILNPGVIFSQ